MPSISNHNDVGIAIPWPRLSWPFELFQHSPRRRRPELEPTPSNGYDPGHSPPPSSNERERPPPPPKEKKEKKEKEKKEKKPAEENKKGGKAAAAEDASEPVPSMIDLRVGHIVDSKWLRRWRP